MIQGRQLRLVEPFDDGEHGRIDEPHIGVLIAVAHIANSPVIRGDQLFDPMRPGDDVVQEGDQDTRVQACAAVDFLG